MPDNAALRPGDRVEWIGSLYVEDGVGAVRAGSIGTFITFDGDDPDDDLVVSFEAVGAFCCGREDVRRLP